MKYLIPIFSILILISSCGKNEEFITFKGTVSDGNNGKALAGAKIILQSSKIQSGVYNPSYSAAASTTTDASGAFSIDILIEKVAGYRVLVSKEDYFEIEEDITTADFEASQNYEGSWSIYPKASIALSVKNTSPQGMDDQIKYRYKNIESQCNSCCNNETKTGTGPDFSESTECDVRGDKWIYISWVVTKSGTQHIYEDSIFAVRAQVTSFNINY